MGLVAVPADPDTDVVFGTENLLDSGSMTYEGLDACNDFRQPGGSRLGALQLALVIVVAEAERSYPPLAFKLAELKRLKRNGPDTLNKFPFDCRRYEVGCVGSPSGSARTLSNKANCSDTKPPWADATYVGFRCAC